MSDPLVTVTAYPAREPAQTAQGALESAGIDSTIDDALDARVKLRVSNLQAIHAGDVLTARCPTLPEIDEADEETADLTCPACGSSDVAPTKRIRMFALIAFLSVALGFSYGSIQTAFFAIATAAVFLVIGGRWHCEMCGEKWD